MANYQNSYDYQNVVRDLSGIFEQLVKSRPTLFGLIKTGVSATNTKHEWINDTLSPTTITIATLVTDGNGTQFTTASTAGLRAGMIVRFTSSAGATKAGLARISNIDSTTQFTIVRNYGGTTLATLAANDVLSLVSEPKGENSTATVTPGKDISTDYNYTEIFDAARTVSRTSMQTNIYGMPDPFAYQMKAAMLEIERKINAASIYGVPVQRTDSVNGTMGGLLNYFLSGGLVESTGGAISTTIINNALEKIFSAGGTSTNYALVCAANQSRKISAFNTSTTNQVVNVPYGTPQAGSYIQKFIGDLAVQNGFSANIIVEPNMPKDQIILLDLDACEYNYMQPLIDMDATTAGQDGFTRRALTELTFTVKNAKEKHALITGLTV